MFLFDVEKGKICETTLFDNELFEGEVKAAALFSFRKR